MMGLRFKKGQSVIEYTILLLLIAAALTVMSTYVMRAMNARLKQTQDELNYYRTD